MIISFKGTNVKAEITKSQSFLEIIVAKKKELLKNALFILVNEDIYDLHAPVQFNNDIEAEIIYDLNHPKFFAILNHTCAHLLAHAIMNLYPKTKFWVGPSIKEGFYYDMDLGELKIDANDFEAIAKEMRTIINSGAKISCKQISYLEAKKMFAKDEYKLDLINNLPEDNLTIYQLGNFIDLCRGPHILDPKLLKNFKLLSVSGAYFKGDSKNKMLTRIYGTCHINADSLDKYLKLLEIRRENDHRKIGKELKLFMINPIIGQGLATWLPMGMRVFERISKYIKSVEKKYGFQHISTPILGSLELYKISGHWKHYHDNMYPVMKIDDEKLLIRPMSCPHHCMVYKNELHSYRELPIRYAEEVIQYRYEASGALSGLERVRGMRLTDAHIFVDIQQLEKEIIYMLKMIEEVLEKFQIKISYYRLSLHDPKDKVSFINDPEIWNKSETILRNILAKSKYKYIEGVGEAAFYGPKIDIQIDTILGHEITISTLQLDFLAARNFKLSYIDENNKKIAPIMLHRGLIGTYERFMSILIEQTAGVFPFWLAPIQVAILALHPNQHKYAKQINNILTKKDIYTELYLENERLSHKIRDAQIKKIPYIFILGDKEVATKTIQVRKHGSEKSEKLTLTQFLQKVKD